MPSSVIKSFDYDEPRKRLEILFVSGRRYIYADVPPDVFQQMRASFSKGEFFNAHIRDRYTYERVQG